MVKWIDILIVALFLLSLYLVLIAIFGHSPTPFEITISVFTTLGILLYNLNREFEEFKIKTVNSFKNVKEDINKIKKGVKGINENLELNNSKLNKIINKLGIK